DAVFGASNQPVASAQGEERIGVAGHQGDDRAGRPGEDELSVAVVEEPEHGGKSLSKGGRRIAGEWGRARGLDVGTRGPKPSIVLAPWRFPKPFVSGVGSSRRWCPTWRFQNLGHATLASCASGSTKRMPWRRKSRARASKRRMRISRKVSRKASSSIDAL